MSESIPFIDLTQGQNDSHGEEGLEFPRLWKVRNTRYTRGYPERRPGTKVLAQCGTDAKSLDFTAGSSHYILVPAHTIHALTPPFSFETLFAPDGVTGTQVLAGFLHATDLPFQFHLSGDDVVVTFTKSGGGTETVTAADVAAIGVSLYVRVTVDAAGDINIYTDASTTAADTNAAGLYGETLIAAGGGMAFGRNNGGNYFDGKLDYFRCVRGVVPDASLAYTWHPTPRAQYMVMDYCGPLDAQGMWWDRSPYENLGLQKNTVGVASSLSVNPAPVQGMKVMRDKNNVTKLLVVAGGRVHLAPI